MTCIFRLGSGLLVSEIVAGGGMGASANGGNPELNEYGTGTSLASGSLVFGGTLSMCSKELHIHCGRNFVLMTIWKPTRAISCSLQTMLPCCSVATGSKTIALLM